MRLLPTPLLCLLALVGCQKIERPLGLSPAAASIKVGGATSFYYTPRDPAERVKSWRATTFGTVTSSGNSADFTCDVAGTFQIACEVSTSSGDITLLGSIVVGD